MQMQHIDADLCSLVCVIVFARMKMKKAQDQQSQEARSAGWMAGRATR